MQRQTSTSSERGVTLMVSCLSRPLEERAARFKLGTLYLADGKPVTWQRPRQVTWPATDAD